MPTETIQFTWHGLPFKSSFNLRKVNSWADCSWELQKQKPASYWLLRSRTPNSTLSTPSSPPWSWGIWRPCRPGDGVDALAPGSVPGGEEPRQARPCSWALASPGGPRPSPPAGPALGVLSKSSVRLPGGRGQCAQQTPSGPACPRLPAARETHGRRSCRRDLG